MLLFLPALCFVGFQTQLLDALKMDQYSGFLDFARLKYDKI